MRKRSRIDEDIVLDEDEGLLRYLPPRDGQFLRNNKDPDGIRKNFKQSDDSENKNANSVAARIYGTEGKITGPDLEQKAKQRILSNKNFATLARFFLLRGPGAWKDNTCTLLQGMWNYRVVVEVIDEIDGALGDGKGAFVEVSADTEKSDGGKENVANEDNAQKHPRRRAVKSELPSRPVICICNDLYAPALRPLRRVAKCKSLTCSNMQQRGMKTNQIGLTAADSLVGGSQVVGRKDMSKSVFDIWKRGIEGFSKKNRRKGDPIMKVRPIPAALNSLSEKEKADLDQLVGKMGYKSGHYVLALAMKQVLINEVEKAKDLATKRYHNKCEFQVNKPQRDPLVFLTDHAGFTNAVKRPVKFIEFLL
uniref:Uncharacterized protein n=1 Tax=Cannabis sativa TaxID=3483 RepID=A0A803Q3L7_CANSA